jgi:hypothetical protein
MLQRREGKIFVAGSKLDIFNTVVEAKESVSTQKEGAKINGFQTQLQRQNETSLTVLVHALESSCSAFTEKKENFIAQRIILLLPMMRPLEGWNVGNN